MGLLFSILALAQTGVTPPVIAQPALPDVVLADMRGGFRLPNGIDVALTVNTQTAVNGAVVLRTEFRVDQGPAMLTTFVPTPGEQVSAPAGGNAVSAGAMGRTTGPTVTYDPRSGLQVTPGARPMPVSIVSGGGQGERPGGLVELPGGAGVTDNGIVDRAGRGVTIAGRDISITHLTGGAFGSVIANAGNDRAIDTQTTVGIDLRNAGPDVIGSAMLRVENVALGALMMRP